MPRAKKPKSQAIETFTIQVDGEEFTCEVWEDLAEEGTQGAHMRRKRDVVYIAVLDYCEDGLLRNSNITKGKFTRLIQGNESLAEFGRIITTIAKTKNVKLGQTLSEEIAQEVRNHYLAIQNALAAQK